MRTVLRNTATTGLLIALEASAVLVLHRLGRVDGLAVPVDHLSGWLSTTDAEVALTAMSRLVALALAWWLLGTSVFYALAHALRRDALAAMVGVVTLPAVRRILDRSIAGAVLATTLVVRMPTASAGPQSSPAPVTAEPRSGRVDPRAAALPEEVRVGRTTPEPGATPTTTTTTSPPSTPAPSPPPEPDPTPGPAPGSTPEPTAPAGEPAPSPASGTYVVGPGDNLWLIAARQVAGPGRTVADVPAAEIAPYWHALIARNGPFLRSGDPNLIFPGEVIAL